MDRTCYFVENKALFGGFPTQESVIEMENNGVRYFLDLTRVGERGTIPYTTKYSYENYPIYDRSCPGDRISFGKLIIKYSKIIKELPNGEKVYVHCRGGHGRSGVVVASLLTWIHKINPQEAMERTTFYHSQRKIMSEKWRRIGSPQCRIQKNFVSIFFKPIYITKHMESSLADVFDNINFELPTEEIFLRVLERIKDNKNFVACLLNTGLGRIIFVSSLPKHRDLISKILNQIRSHLFECLEEI